MNRRSLTTLTLGLVLTSAAAFESAAGADAAPEGWTVERSWDVPPELRAGIARKLGAPVAKLTSTVYSVQGQRLQLNVMEAGTQEEAQKLEQALIKLKGNPRLVHRRSNTVAELVCSDMRLAMDARYRLGWQPSRVVYRVSFDAAPLQTADYMAWNRLFNLFLEHQRTPAGEQQPVQERIAELAKKFQFGDELTLRRSGLGAVESKFTLAPLPIKAEADARRACQFYSLKDLPRKAGVPYVSVVAEVTSQTYALLPAEGNPGPELLAATRHWPSDDAKFRDLAKQITKDCADDGQRIKALMDWLLPGKNVRFAGAVVGSRYGVPTVLDQGYGHCWDFSDCFVTLARASGVPCRQVAGWLYGQSGHVWAEVLTADGWQQVDPTAGMGCGSDYIPLLTSESGELALLYTSLPRIEKLEPAND